MMLADEFKEMQHRAERVEAEIRYRQVFVCRFIAVRNEGHKVFFSDCQ